MGRGFRLLLFILILINAAISVSGASSEFLFSDNRFRNKMTTENLDAIIDEYELFDGWYWTTKADVQQDFHGHADSPGWTTSVSSAKRKDYLKGWYGCRWPLDKIRKEAPDEGGYAECFAFAQFIGYLLSGEINPQHNWEFYYSTDASDGLRVGDIVRVEYTVKKPDVVFSTVQLSMQSTVKRSCSFRYPGEIITGSLSGRDLRTEMS